MLSIAIALGVVAPAPAAAPDKPAAACRAPVYRQFDFWLGDWDTYRVDAAGKVAAGAKPVARNRVTTILGDCVLHEVYTRADGYAGESFTIYDAARHLWHQSWVTNQGELAVAEGTLHGRRIVLQGPSSDASGTMPVRISWQPQGKGVRETAVASHDHGKTWAPLFDILFLPHRSS